MICECGCGETPNVGKRFVHGHNRRIDQIVRFYALVGERGEGCWEWAGSRNNKGYGQFRADGRLHLAHRVAYELEIGAVPQGSLVLHRCDNRRCVNPRHLFLGSALDNTRDMVAKGRENFGGRRARERDPVARERYPARPTARPVPDGDGGTRCLLSDDIKRGVQRAVGGGNATGS